MNTSAPAGLVAFNGVELLFPLGAVCATPAAISALADAGLSPAHFVTRHVTGDWQGMSVNDIAANADAVRSGGRIVSGYDVPTERAEGVRLYVITEQDRSSTTLLLADEY